MRRSLLRLACCSVLVLAGACGGNGGGDDDGSASSGRPADATTTSSSLPGSDGKLPGFSSDFSRVCATQTGFSGGKAYEAGPGPHPMVFFESDGPDESFVKASVEFPEGWLLEDDSNFEDNSELAGVELVGCSQRVKEVPTGKKCDFGKDDEPKTTLELVNSTYEVKVFAATTGAQVGDSVTIEATEDECPFIATFKTGDTTFVDEPDDNDYINALKAVVAPG